MLNRISYFMEFYHNLFQFFRNSVKNSEWCFSLIQKNSTLGPEMGKLQHVFIITSVVKRGTNRGSFYEKKRFDFFSLPAKLKFVRFFLTVHICFSQQDEL